MKGEPGPLGDPGTPGTYIIIINCVYLSIIMIMYIKINFIYLFLVSSILMKGLTQ